MNSYLMAVALTGIIFGLPLATINGPLGMLFVISGMFALVSWGVCKAVFANPIPTHKLKSNKHEKKAEAYWRSKYE